MTVHNNNDSINAAWSFYSQEQDLNNQLNTAIQNAGNPDFDPNDASSAQTS